jgi:hypothetical protein
MGHFLSALELQQASGSIISTSGVRSVMSDNLWTAVDTTLLLMKRSDLLTAVNERNLETLSRVFSKDLGSNAHGGSQSGDRTLIY